MMDPANDLLPPQSSPTNSSSSSSDLDTESTGSFFHDRSTTLGSLMGVSFPAITFRAPSRSHSQNRCQIPPPTTDAASSNTRGRKSKNPRKNRASAATAAIVPMDWDQRRRWRRRRWKWWSLCRDDCDRHPSSLGEYLEVERRFGDVAFFSRAAEELEGVGGRIDVRQNNDGMLFADGRVLPPREIGGGEPSSSAAVPGGLCSFSVVSLSGICSGGGGGWG